MYSRLCQKKAGDGVCRRRLGHLVIWWVRQNEKGSWRRETRDMESYDFWLAKFGKKR
jgi:hypothetical protein